MDRPVTWSKAPRLRKVGSFFVWPPIFIPSPQKFNFPFPSEGIIIFNSTSLTTQARTFRGRREYRPASVIGTRVFARRMRIACKENKE
jgi:hypothetical protein